MKRLFACIGFSRLMALTVVFYFGTRFGSLLSLVAIALVPIFFIFKKLRKHKINMMCIAVVFVLSCINSYSYTHYFYQPAVDRYDGETVSVTAILKNTPYKIYGSWNYDLETEKIDGKCENMKIMLHSNRPLDIEFNDRLNMEMTLYECKSIANKSKGYIYEGRPDGYNPEYTPEKRLERDIFYYPVVIKERLVHAVNTLIPGEEGSICNALALGERHGLSKGVYDDFCKTGLTYLIVVSGLHMNIVVSFLMLLMNRFSHKSLANTLRCVAASLCILMFMAITGFAPSSIRSGIMILFCMGASIFRRRADSLNNMGVASIVLTLFNPYAVGDLGLLYSFASTFGILVLNPRISEFFRKRLENRKLFESVFGRILWYILSMISVTLSATAFVMPVSLLLMGSANPLTIVLSLLVIPIMSVLLFLSLFAATLWYVPFLQWLSYALAYIGYYLAKYVRWIVGLCSKIPYASILMTREYVVLWLILSASAVGIIVILKRGRGVIKYGITFSYMIFLILFCFTLIDSPDGTELYIPASGNGTTAVLLSKGGKDVLACGGSKWYISDVIKKIKLKYGDVNSFIVPGTQNSDSGYGADMLEEFDVKSVMLYYRYTTNEKVYRLAEKCDDNCKFTDGDRVTIKLNGGVTDTLIGIGIGSWQYIKGSKATVLLAPSGADCSTLPKKYRKADIVVLNGKIINSELLKYDCIVWKSWASLPVNLKNAKPLADEDISIELN